MTMRTFPADKLDKRLISITWHYAENGKDDEYAVKSVDNVPDNIRKLLENPSIKSIEICFDYTSRVTYSKDY